MARLTAYAGATLSVTLKEDLTIDGRDYGGLQEMSIASITDVTRRIATITTTETTIATFAAAVGAGAYIAADVLYIRFSNLDDTNFITLTFRNQDNDEVAIKLDAGKSLILCGDNSGGMVDVFNATQDADVASDTGLGDLTNIQADANSGSVDLEMYIASK
jgi:hypothetical protein